VAMFDFTSLFQAENASRFLERKGKRLLMALIGDSLLEVSIKTFCLLITNHVQKHKLIS
jgi:hypothetical protein